MRRHLRCPSPSQYALEQGNIVRLWILRLLNSCSKFLATPSWLCHRFITASPAPYRGLVMMRCENLLHGVLLLDYSRWRALSTASRTRSGAVPPM
ncbi:MAG: hypothetical protein Kow0096_08720 [Thiohalomonadaceae bacterium]